MTLLLLCISLAGILMEPLKIYSRFRLFEILVVLSEFNIQTAAHLTIKLFFVHRLTSIYKLMFRKN